MNTRGLLILAAVTVLVLVLALALSGPGSAPPESEEQPLVPGLREVVNQVDAVDVIGSDGQTIVSLRRDQERWRVQEKDNFEADFDRVHDLLRDLATGQRANERTSNPDWYARLGVQDAGAPDARSVRIDFPGTELPSLIVGDVDSSEQGHFVRLAGQARTWLTDLRLEIPTDRIEWLERSIMDIPATELAEVTLRHPDGSTVQLRPAGEGSQDWVLMNVPDGREAAPLWEIRPLANGLANMRLDDVRRHDSIPEDAVRALFVTRDGLNFVASLFEDDAGRWVHFSVSAEVTASASAELSEDAARISADAAAVDARLSPWQYRLSERKFGYLTRRLDELLAEPDEE